MRLKTQLPEVYSKQSRTFNFHLLTHFASSLRNSLYNTSLKFKVKTACTHFWHAHTFLNKEEEKTNCCKNLTKASRINLNSFFSFSHHQISHPLRYAPIRSSHVSPQYDLSFLSFRGTTKRWKCFCDRKHPIRLCFHWHINRIPLSVWTVHKLIVHTSCKHTHTHTKCHANLCAQQLMQSHKMATCTELSQFRNGEKTPNMRQTWEIMWTIHLHVRCDWKKAMARAMRKERDNQCKSLVQASLASPNCCCLGKAPW